MRMADASRATAEYRSSPTNEFYPCQEKPYYEQLLEDPELLEDSIQTMFAEALGKDDKTALKKYGPQVAVVSKRVREETGKIKMSKLKVAADKPFNARRAVSQ